MFVPLEGDREKASNASGQVVYSHRHAALRVVYGAAARVVLRRSGKRYGSHSNEIGGKGLDGRFRRGASAV